MKCPHRRVCLNAWSPANSTVSVEVEPLGYGASMADRVHWGVGLKGYGLAICHLSSLLPVGCCNEIGLSCYLSLGQAATSHQPSWPCCTVLKTGSQNKPSPLELILSDVCTTRKVAMTAVSRSDSWTPCLCYLIWLNGLVRLKGQL